MTNKVYGDNFFNFVFLSNLCRCASGGEAHYVRAPNSIRKVAASMPPLIILLLCPWERHLTLTFLLTAVQLSRKERKWATAILSTLGFCTEQFIVVSTGRSLSAYTSTPAPGIYPPW